MRLGRSGLILWALYGAFALFAFYLNVDENTFRFNGPLGFAKAAIWLALFIFLAYSVQCSFRENFYRSVRSIAAMYWGRQVGADLYLGLLLALFIIYLNDGALIALLWLAPVLIYANLVVLLYFAINFESIAMKLLVL